MLVLSELDVRELTGKTRPSAQVRALQVMGIPYVRRPDGSLAVHRANVDAALGAVAQSVAKAPRTTEPNWAD